VKKSFIIGLLLYLYVVICSAQQPIDDYIDDAVSQATQYLENRLPRSANITIVNNTSDELEEAVFHQLEINLVNGEKIRVLERNKKNLQLIADELHFQYSGGEVSDDSLVALGRKLGAQYIVLVSVKPQGGSKYLFRVKAVSVETAQIIASNAYTFQRQVSIQSHVMVDYMLKQITYDEISAHIRTGDVYLGLGFRIHSEVNIENLPQDIIDSASSSRSEPKNICFVIDISGSMGDDIYEKTKKIEWVKREIKRFIENNIGENDVISVVAFDDTFDEVIHSKLIKNKNDIEWCISQIKELNPRGGTMIAQGLRKGYELVKVNKKADYINCVILFTDGESNQGYDQEEVKKIVAENKSNDIATISTVALSTSAKAFMTEVANIGGGFSLSVGPHNASRSMEKEMVLLANAATVTLKNKDHRLDIKLSAHEEVIFRDVSREHTGWNGDFAYYSIDIREDEYKTIWIKASLGQNVIRTGSILSLEVTGNTLLTNKYQIFLKPPYVTTYNKTRILSIYHKL
jgi:Mg-chelatase subunit ChlD